MKTTSASVVSGVIAGAALAVLLVALVVTGAAHPELQRLVHLETAPHSVSGGEVHSDAGTVPEVDKLPCFGCHNIERYHTGESFPHDKHGLAGHCHVCHAFAGHAQAPTRREACEECHSE